MKGSITIFIAAALWAGTAELPIAPLGTYKPMERKYWAFQARKAVTPPQFANPADKAWVKTPIDAFILDGLKKAGSEACAAGRSRDADSPRHLRSAPVCRLLRKKWTRSFTTSLQTPGRRWWIGCWTSPHYGEQWGRHWLDVVRFAESDGYEYDTHRPDAYRYRDYVVRSFNHDKPYNEFVKEQLAGDEMDPKNEEYLVASGFNRLGPLRKNAGNQKVASSRNEVLIEMTNIVGAAFLGVTVGCARCHDHKFDPFRQSDYYRMHGLFRPDAAERSDTGDQRRAGGLEETGRAGANAGHAVAI